MLQIKNHFYFKPPKPQKHAETWEQFGSASSSFQQPENGQKPQQQQQRQPQQPQGSSAGQWQQQQQLSQQLAESASISGFVFFWSFFPRVNWGINSKMPD
jgi:hypothetical protein